MSALVHDGVNKGVSRAGSATAREKHDVAVTALFARLDWLAVYVGHFKCNLRRLVDYPLQWGYARDRDQRPGFGETVDLDHIARHHYTTHARLNPTRIVPLGPLVDWAAPRDRDRLP